MANDPTNAVVTATAFFRLRQQRCDDLLRLILRLRRKIKRMESAFPLCRRRFRHHRGVPA
jgi:hypothetical protein